MDTPTSWSSTLIASRAEPARARNDLPANGERLYAEARGIAHLFVNGREVVADDQFTGDLGGTLLRSGRDTETVSVPGATAG